MKNYKKTCLIARKKCLHMANQVLKIPLKVTEPIEGLPESEVSYNGWTALTILTFPRVDVVRMTGEFSCIILPTIWNYIDAACALTIGVNQLLDEDNYRQKQMKIKGLLNVMSGIQLFIFTYNPALVAAVGLAGAPIAFAGLAFALGALVDTLTAAIDLCSASEELSICGWLDERKKEYEFLERTIKELQEENKFLSNHMDPSKPDKDIQWTLDKNYARMSRLIEKEEQLKEKLFIRARVHPDKVSDKYKIFLKKLDPNFDDYQKPSLEDVEKDELIQKKLTKNYEKERKNVIVKTTSFIGMTLLAVGTFALFTTCPYAVSVVGLAITVAITALYLYRHQNAVAKYLNEAIKDCKNTFFSSKEPSASKSLSNKEELSDAPLNSRPSTN